MENQNSENLTAAQRLKNLEDMSGLLKSVTYQMDQSLQSISDAVQKNLELLTALYKAVTTKGVVAPSDVENALVDIKTGNLKRMVDGFIEGGVLVKTDVVSNDSFVVGREIGSDGKVLTPRAQYPVSSLDQESAALFLNKKVGEQVSSPSTPEVFFEIEEIYAVKDETEEEQTVQ